MQAALFTVILSTVINDAHLVNADIHPASSAQYDGLTNGVGEDYGGAYPPDAKFGHGALHVYFGPMPQTCYGPRHGCWPANSRFMHRYPAFHGWFYRSPYHYRHSFDYPWHAKPHEPSPLASPAPRTTFNKTHHGHPFQRSVLRRLR